MRAHIGPSVSSSRTVLGSPKRSPARLGSCTGLGSGKCWLWRASTPAEYHSRLNSPLRRLVPGVTAVDKKKPPRWDCTVLHRKGADRRRRRNNESTAIVESSRVLTSEKIAWVVIFCGDL